MSETGAVLVMVGALLVGLASGLPLAWVIGSIAMAAAILFWGTKSIFAMVSAAYATMQNWVLIATPLFILMAVVLNYSGIIERLYDAAYKWAGGLRGGLAVGTILACTIFAACTGITAGAVVAMGLIALPSMLKYRYDKGIAIGSVVAGGTLGQLIPPSVMIIMYGLVTPVSVGKMFAGGAASGIILSALYCSYVLVRSFFQKELCPALPPGERVNLRAKVVSLKELVLPVFLVVSVLGAIFTGAASPTEAAGVGAAGAFLCAIVVRKLSLSLVKNSVRDTIRLCGMLGWLVAACTAFAYTFLAIGGRPVVEGLLLSMPMGKWGALALSMLILLIMGMLVDTVAMVLVAGPILAPIMASLGFDPVWFGILFMVQLQIGYISPPFGYSLFYVAGVAPSGITLTDIYKASLPFVGLQLVGLTIFIVFPVSFMWLPNMLFQ
jgi:tripartite ATP-independent transporter DctM subunit